MADVNVNFELEPDVTFLADLTVETSTPTVHGELSGRDYPNQHPISAITGLEQELSDLGSETQEGKTAYETIQTYGNIVTHNVNEFATASQGELSLTALQPNDNISELTNNAGYITNSALNGYATETYVDTGLATKQATLVSGTNIKTINNESVLGSGNINIESGAVDSVNGQTGDVVLTASDVGALPSTTVIPTKTSDLTNDSGFITSSAIPTNYVTTNTTQTITGAKTFANTTIIDLGATSGASLTVKGSGSSQAILLQRTNGATGTLEAGGSVVLFGSKTNHPLQIRVNYSTQMTIGTNGSVILATAPDVSSNNNQVATTKWVNDKGYITNSAIANMQTTTNLVTSVSSSSTDSQYPSAKLFYDTCGDIETALNTIRGV